MLAAIVLEEERSAGFEAGLEVFCGSFHLLDTKAAGHIQTMKERITDAIPNVPFVPFVPFVSFVPFGVFGVFVSKR